MQGIMIIFATMIAVIVLPETYPLGDSFICDVMDRFIPSIHILIGIAAWPIWCNKSQNVIMVSDVYSSNGGRKSRIESAYQLQAIE